MLNLNDVKDDGRREFELIPDNTVCRVILKVLVRKQNGLKSNIPLLVVNMTNKSFGIKFLWMVIK